VIIVSDTSPIANLIVIGYISLLPQLFETIVIPDVVYWGRSHGRLSDRSSCFNLLVGDRTQIRRGDRLTMVSISPEFTTQMLGIAFSTKCRVHPDRL
jgi:hypothetical protein